MREGRTEIHVILEDVLKFHDKLSKTFKMKSGIHSYSLLESAINVPFQTFAGKDLYPSIIDKAARLAFGIAKNHAFIDGNKRTAIHTMLAFLKTNGVKIKYGKDEMKQVIINVAKGEMSAVELSKWLEAHEDFD